MVDGGSYITIGDMYKGNNTILPDRWKGKSLSVSCMSYISDTLALTSSIDHQDTAAAVLPCNTQENTPPRTILEAECHNNGEHVLSTTSDAFNQPSRRNILRATVSLCVLPVLWRKPGVQFVPGGGCVVLNIVHGTIQHRSYY